MPDRFLGTIARLQVQRDPLKTKGVGYDPSGILAVAEAAIGPHGIVGRHHGGWVIDTHHAAHPRSQGAGWRALSLGFTGHYEMIAARFGAAPAGCAGENVVVEADGRFFAGDLQGEIVIQASGGEVPLRGARVAAPCAEFTSWLKGLDVVVPKLDQRDDVDFLDDGMRGFILAVDHLDRPLIVRLGDPVVLRV